MVEEAFRISEKIEHQLCQVIVYLGAIDSLAEAYRDYEPLQQDAFLCQTVYEGLWDALIVRMGTVWDRTRNVASLPKLSNALKHCAAAEMKAIAREIDRSESAERRKLKEWRDTLVAHKCLALDPIEFDGKYPLNTADVRREAEHVERLLTSTNRVLGRQTTYYEVLKEDALRNARTSLARWCHGV